MTALSEIKKLLVWMYLVPVGSVWTAVSFLPAIGLLQTQAPPVTLLIEAFFLGTGFVGIAAVWASLCFMAPPANRGALSGALKGRPVFIAIYTTLWLAAYSGFQFVDQR